MDLINVKTGETVLVICESSKELEIEDSLKNISNKTFITPHKIPEYEENSNSWILVCMNEENITNTVLSQIFKLLKPGAQLIITKVLKDVENVEFLLKTTGLTNVQVEGNNVVSTKPKYEIGSSSKLSLKKKTVWKLDDDLDEAETIDPDNLLDDDDLLKPDPSSLRVCGTTGKRKACKDCSCGLADELANEAKTGQVIDTTNTPKSSCGNCYLGDAFRCASCPYLGMPAFKPGEKIQLTDTLLKADI